jgi:iron complex outermembrane receptor protein
MNKLLSSASVLVFCVASGVAYAADLAADASSDTSTLSEVIVTGTRQVGVKAADSAAPIELVGDAALKRTGSIDLASALATSVPSLNIQANGADAAAVSIQAALRGLSPNDTLVLVDGKRRHPTSNLAVDGGSVYSGTATTDLSYIPVDAIDHIEVLTDGAAAQYGTDAIAGVVNIILKKNDSGGTLTSTGGEYYNGGGETGTISLNDGFKIGDHGFANITLEERYHNFSEAGIGDRRLQNPNGTPLAGLTYPESNVTNANNYPYENRIDGDPQSNLYNAFLNAGYDLGGGVQFYTFGNYSYREAQHYENYRTPNKVSGVTSTGEEVYPLPDGFDPREKFDEKDYSITAGFKGDLVGWDWDLSTTYGENNTQVYVVDSANAQLFPVLQALSATPITPQTTFYNGGFDATELTNNLDLDRTFKVGLASPLNVALGFEERRDTYGITAGEPSSYYGAGAQSFDGYTPLDQSEHSRTNEAAYLDLAVDPVKGLHTDIAGRYEHYSDFGDATVGKFTSRYDFNSMFAVRGTVSTGFRAPTLAEEYYSGTNVSPTSAEVQLPPNSAAAALAGFAPLKPEKSDNFSIGFVAHPLPDLQFTVDAYEIDIRDRILVTGLIYGTNTIGGTTVLESQGVLNAIAAKGVTLDSGLSYTGISTFSNAANTRTDGIEATGNYASDFGDWGHVDWSMGFNYNKTQITKVLPLPSEVTSVEYGQTAYLTPETASALTTATPREKVILQAFWNKDKWSVNLRETIYGSTSEYTATTPAILETIGVTGITDLDIGFKVTRRLKLDVGANNLFDILPPLTPNVNGKPINGAVVYNEPYGFAPWGINGGYYYGRVTYSF